MKVRVWVEVDVNFDTESDGVQHGEEVINRDTVISTVTKCLQAAMKPILEHDMMDCLTDDTGFCIKGLSATVGNDDPVPAGDEVQRPELSDEVVEVVDEASQDLLEKLSNLGILDPEDAGGDLVFLQDVISDAVKGIVVPGSQPKA